MMLIPPLILSVAALAPNDLADVLPPKSVKVLPVFFVPKGETPPTEAQSDAFMRHLNWTRKRYSELLPEHVTFGIAARKPLVFDGADSLSAYRTALNGGASKYVSELLAKLHYTRWNCPYVFMILVMNPHDDYPGGGGQPLNGGFNTGPAMVMMSSAGLDKYPNLQSTMQHELGHSFGLPHVDVYNYDMAANPSIMSYNPTHHTDYFKPSPTPGRMIPEDIRGLALNQRVFPGLRFIPDRDVPKGYTIAPRIIGLGPMELDGMPIVKVTTQSGSEDGGAPGAVLIGPMTPIVPGAVPEFDPGTMWKSSPASDGWVTLNVELPRAVRLSRVVIHTMPSGTDGAAQAVRVTAEGGAKPNAERPLTTADDSVPLTPALAQRWRFEFRGAPGASVIVRGLEFFVGKDQVFLPLIPFTPIGR